MKRLSKERELNNAGLTLVELLIAMVILAIIVTPILKNFVASAKINNKSRHTMNATGLCETLMEEFESRKVSEMVDVLVNDYGYSIPDYDETYDNIYSIKGVETLLSGTQYEVEITLNGHDTYEALNQQTVYDIQNFSGGTNAIYSENGSMEVYSAQYFKSLLPSHIDPYEEIHKEITIEIKKDSISLVISPSESVTLPVYEVRAKCFYKYGNAAQLDDSGKDFYPLDGNEMLIFSNEEELRKLAEEVRNGNRSKEDLISRLDNILICWIPSMYSPNNMDYIVIDNKDNVPTNIMIVEQARADLQGSGDVKLSVELKEFHDEWDATHSDGVYSYAKLRSNVNWDFSNPASGKKLTFTNSRYSISESGEKAHTMLNGTDVAPKIKLNRLYDITIDVYNNETKDKVLSMTGTVTD